MLPDTATTNQLSSMLAHLGLPRGAELRETPLARHFRSRPAANSRRRHEPVDSRHFLYLRLPPRLTIDECVRRLEAHPLIDYAEPDWIGAAATTIPADPNFADQWYHQNSTKPSASIQTPLAWDITRGSANVLVAVIDSGIMPLPEFAGRTVPGYNFAYDEADTTDDNGHGTAVARRPMREREHGSAAPAWTGTVASCQSRSSTIGTPDSTPGGRRALISP
ncbi:MAG: hypothetical protein IPK15_05380 [Verrucomicrobia bacterium]|nr:hypothetical protein [Verrucomicrobiota bacterium]